MLTVSTPRFGTLLRRFRQMAGPPQEVLTDNLVHLSERGIQKLERDVSHLPRRDTVELLATALERTAEGRLAGPAALISAAAGQRAQQTGQCPGWFLRASYACRYGW